MLQPKGNCIVEVQTNEGIIKNSNDIITRNDKVVVKDIRDQEFIYTIKSAVDLDFSKLQQLLDICDQLQENDYTEESWLEFVEIRQEARTVLENAVSQNDIDSAIEKLQLAKDNLIEKEIKIDKLALSIAVEMANNITEEQLANVVPAVVNEFKAALQEATVILADDSASQETVNASFTRLSKVMQMLEFVKGDKSELEALINEANSYVEKDYTAGSWAALQEALEAAKEVVANEDATETEVMDAYNNLRDAIDNLVDKSWLQKLYDAIEESDKSKYTPASLEGLTEAMESTRAVLEDPDVTQEEVDNAYNELARAWLNLRLKADKELLQGLYDKVSGIDIERYTEASAERFIEAAAKAKEVLEDPNVNQEGVDNASSIK